MLDQILSGVAKGFFHDNDSRMIPACYEFSSKPFQHLTSFKNICRFETQIVPEVIFTFEEYISDLVFELSDNEPFVMCTSNVL